MNNITCPCYGYCPFRGNASECLLPGGPMHDCDAYMDYIYMGDEEGNKDE